MAKKSPANVSEYLSSLPADRRESVERVRRVILKNLPKGYEEAVDWGMLVYQVPLSTLPETYNGKPLCYAALAPRKNYISLHLMNVYGDGMIADWFKSAFKASGKPLNMGKSCVRFKTADDLPLDVVGQAIARTPSDAFVERCRTVWEKRQEIKPVASSRHSRTVRTSRSGSTGLRSTHGTSR